MDCGDDGMDDDLGLLDWRCVDETPNQTVQYHPRRPATNLLHPVQKNLRSVRQSMQYEEQEEGCARNGDDGQLSGASESADGQLCRGLTLHKGDHGCWAHLHRCLLFHLPRVMRRMTRSSLMYDR